MENVDPSGIRTGSCKLLAESLYSITRSVEFEKVTELLPYDQTVVSLYE